MMNWDERYDTEDYVYGRDANDFLMLVEPHLKRKARVLCIGEGEGRNALFLLKKGHTVQAVDSSQVARVKCQKLCHSYLERLRYDVMDLGEYKPQDQFDAVIAIWCHLDDALRSQVHRRVVNSLAPGGLFILEAYRPEQLQYPSGGPKSEDMLVTPEKITNDLQGLEIHILQETTRRIHEGSGHHGISATLQVLAQKK